MLTFARTDGRRVFVLGVAGLVPAAIVTLLLVHQPSIGDRRLYPLLRAPLTAVGLVLAVATIVAWGIDHGRFSRRNLSGLAWAGVTVTLCIGPFLESTPRARLYALDLDDGDVVWTRKRAVRAPVLVEGVLVVTDIGSGDRIGLDPETGDEVWRRAASAEDAPLSPDVEPACGPEAVDDGIRGECAGSPWMLPFPQETVVVVDWFGGAGYAYVTTEGADDQSGGAIVSFDVDDGTIRWRKSLPPTVVVGSGTPALDASGGAVVVAGGERVAMLAAESGELVWSESIASLGKSRGYVLPGSFQEVIVTDRFVYLLATPQS